MPLSELCQVVAVLMMVPTLVMMSPGVGERYLEHSTNHLATLYSK